MRQSKNVLTSVVMVFSLVVGGPALARANQTTTKSQRSINERTKSKTNRVRNRRSGPKRKILNDELTVFSAATAGGDFPELITISPGSRNVELSATLKYIKERMSSYGSQKGYVDSEVIKDSVKFEECDEPKKPSQELVKTPGKSKEGHATSWQGEKPETPPSVTNCKMKWTVEYTDDSDKKKERTITLTLAHLNLDEVFQSQGVVWIKTVPNKTIIVESTGSPVLKEDEWWIDLHDEEVARRVGRALKHAAKVCRGDKYVEEFAK